jgi:hypothetical protein
MVILPTCIILHNLYNYNNKTPAIAAKDPAPIAIVLAPPEEEPAALELESPDILDEAADFAEETADLTEEALEVASDFKEETPPAILEATGSSEESAAMASPTTANKVKYFILGLYMEK